MKGIKTMTTKDLKKIFENLPDDTTVKMLACRSDNVNDNFDIENIVKITPFAGTEYKDELVLIPE